MPSGKIAIFRGAMDWKIKGWKMMYSKIKRAHGWKKRIDSISRPRGIKD
jgi:hypothetical protein